MPTYITLIHYTEKGVKTFTDLSQRLVDTRKLGEELGARLIAYYVTMGEYDAVAITEAPDDATMARIALAAATHGNVRTSTMRAFTESEALEIAAAM